MSIYEYDEERELKIIREDERKLGREEGKELGKMEILVKSVENVMKSLCISMDEACRIIRTSMEEYEQAKCNRF